MKFGEQNWGREREEKKEGTLMGQQGKVPLSGWCRERKGEP